MKKIQMFQLAGLFMVLSSFTALLQPPLQVSAALSDDEKRACWTRWAGRSTGTSGGGDAKTYDEATFNRSRCAREGACEIERYQDGSVIRCFNVDTGEMDSNNVDNRPSAGAIYNISGENADCTASDKLSLNWDLNRDGCSNTADLITMLFRVLAGIVGIAVVGGITWGGMLYASSNGNASKAQQGITVIVNAVIGLLLFIFMFAITNFIVPGGVIG